MLLARNTVALQSPSPLPPSSTPPPTIFHGYSQASLGNARGVALEGSAGDRAMVAVVVLEPVRFSPLVVIVLIRRGHLR